MADSTTMEPVNAFNNELQSLYDLRPPISKAKMQAITKCAMRGVKFYKHVVQSVEKFLQKCKVEYKIAGLYVIDSIVRQSRHQFGAEKDMFAPRFAKNMLITFYFIYQCNPEEKSKIIRVLNLWQKNNIFGHETLDPVFDMADANHPKYKEVAAIVAARQAAKPPVTEKKPTAAPAAPTAAPATQAPPATAAPPVTKAAPVGAKTTPAGAKATVPKAAAPAPGAAATPAVNGSKDLNSRLQQLSHIFGGEVQPETKPSEPQPQAGGAGIKFDKKILNFDYESGEEEQQVGENEQKAPPPVIPTSQPPPLLPPGLNLPNLDAIGSILSNPDLVRQLANIQNLQLPLLQPPVSEAQVMQEPPRMEQPKSEAMGFPFLHGPPPGLPFLPPPFPLPNLPNFPNFPNLPNLPNLQNLAALANLPNFPGMPNPFLGLPLPFPPPGPQNNLSQNLQQILGQLPPPQTSQESQVNQAQLQGAPLIQASPAGQPPVSQPQTQQAVFQTPMEQAPAPSTQQKESEVPVVPVEDEPEIIIEREKRRSRSNSRDDRRRRRSRSGSRDRKRRRSRSRDRRRRSRSRSPNRRRRFSRERDREGDEPREKEREKERERKKRGLPSIKKDHLSVCSTTLWVGHLSKLVKEEDLSNTFSPYGELTSIDLIPPRGCAFVCMSRRQDAYKALTKLSGFKLQGKVIQLAWAPGRGLKGKDFRDYWEVDQGVSYIPWEKITSAEQLMELEEGGHLDEETLPPQMRGMELQHTPKIPIPGEKPSAIPPPSGIPPPQPGPQPGPPMGLHGVPLPPGMPGMFPPQEGANIPSSVPPTSGPMHPFPMPPNLPGLLQGLPIGLPPGLPPLGMQLPPGAPPGMPPMPPMMQAPPGGPLGLPRFPPGFPLPGGVLPVAPPQEMDVRPPTDDMDVDSEEEHPQAPPTGEEGKPQGAHEPVAPPSVPPPAVPTVPPPVVAEPPPEDKPTERKRRGASRWGRDEDSESNSQQDWAALSEQGGSRSNEEQTGEKGSESQDGKTEDQNSANQGGAKIPSLLDGLNQFMPPVPGFGPPPMGGPMGGPPMVSPMPGPPMGAMGDPRGSPMRMHGPRPGMEFPGMMGPMHHGFGPRGPPMGPGGLPPPRGPMQGGMFERFRMPMNGEIQNIERELEELRELRRELFTLRLPDRERRERQQEIDEREDYLLDILRRNGAGLGMPQMPFRPRMPPMTPERFDFRSRGGPGPRFPPGPGPAPWRTPVGGFENREDRPERPRLSSGGDKSDNRRTWEEKENKEIPENRRSFGSLNEAEKNSEEQTANPQAVEEPVAEPKTSVPPPEERIQETAEPEHESTPAVESIVESVAPEPEKEQENPEPKEQAGSPEGEPAVGVDQVANEMS